MAHTIKLKYGSLVSWSYIDLTDGNHGDVDYYPGTPDEGADEIIESGTWRIAGSSVSDLITKINEIEQVFLKARAYDLDQVGAYQVWLTMQPDGVSETWESQVFEGRLELTENIFGGDWANRVTEIVLTWRRAPWWEKYTQLTISNSNGSGTSTVIFSLGDSTGTAPTKKENWIDIAAAQVTGDLPAPTAIYLSGAGFSYATRITVINNIKSNPTMSIIAEGETGSGDGTDAACSGGKYHDYTTPVGGTSGVNVSTSGTGLDGLQTGSWLRFFVTAKFTGTVYCRPFISIEGKYYYGAKNVLVGSGSVYQSFDVGSLRVPGGDLTNYAGFADGVDSIYVGVNFLAASAITISLDYFNFIPTDYYAKALFDTYNIDLALLDTHSKKCIGNVLYPTANAVGAFGTFYGGLYLDPGVSQRLIFKTDIDGNEYLAAYFTAEVYAWLRKRTL